MLAAVCSTGRTVDAGHLINPDALGRRLDPVDALLVPVEEEALGLGVVCKTEPENRGRSLR